ncbi:MAG TPA: 23S rRNA (guanosine(2251)-2'-O)-methyltransferase RlmB [Jatrophihabitantaceae bacterium]|jgi:23S rRNA (guanosine2251-2'-O)-methyltransferase|nr:23S rRNA (guanosine(2251)-2'-O)-methyltransferase RlmB [Jatrophihabitantaceae bacterium]
MAGNSARRGAVRKGKKGASVGSGGQRRRGVAGKGPTPKAEDRTGHPARRRAAAGAKRDDAARQRSRRSADAPELLLGRNPVAEALRAKVPANALYLAIGIDADERVTEAIRLAGNRNVPLLEVSRNELDRMTGGLVHQGMALAVPPFGYVDLPDLLERTAEAQAAGLLVAVDGVTDPRNLGAIIRSALAFGAQGVVIPQRRAAGVTPVAWRTSAGAAARVPVARVTNFVRALKDCQKAGLFALGLDADGDVTLDELEVAVDPLVVVVGSEGRGLSRLAAEACDMTVAIPMAAAAESLNASVAAAVTLAEIARRRRNDAS